jgi:hypothetical protein
LASDYQSIYAENEKRYGTDIGRIGAMLLADRYADRTHFIFELLQNAEDALGRRSGTNSPCSVDFKLTEESLKISHFGQPFDDANVRAICGIAQSTKDFTAIGRFGIGFKSVYTFTDRPEIHSGDEDFAILKYVLPIQTERFTRSDDQTIIVLPLKPDDHDARTDITNGLMELGANSLLFLRNIEEITWSLPDGISGFYIRSKPQVLGANVRLISVIGEKAGECDSDQNWLVFDRDVSMTTDDMIKTGRVEIAFSLIQSKNSSAKWAIQPVVDSPLVVYFPTVVSTNLGFLVQGHYRTTPSRDNVPREDKWNQYLVNETANLLIQSLNWLRDSDMLDTAALFCLPIERVKFPPNSMFAPLFEAVRHALKSEQLLPSNENKYIAASQAKLARTKEIRELFSSDQLAKMFDAENLTWLSSDITTDRAPILRQYLMNELSVAEITPESIIPKLQKNFLEAQTDDWIVRLYQFFSGQPALRSRLDFIPLIRLEDGSHINARLNGQPQAFLPSNIATDFPTMGRSVCVNSDVIEFLESLGIRMPDPVDDVVRNVLPKYQKNKISNNPKDYAADIERILVAFNTDSKSHKEKLVSALQDTNFIMVVNMGDNSKWFITPRKLYLATENLKKLFSGVDNIYIVNDEYDCLRGQKIRDLLEACGAARCPRPIEFNNSTLSYHELEVLRKTAGQERTNNQHDKVVDYSLDGFDVLLKILPTLTNEERVKRANLIWDSLGDLEERRGHSVFQGEYTWMFHNIYKAKFPSAFIKHLNFSAWVPDQNGDLHKPESILFDSLGWEANPFLLTKINFKPPILEQLAKEAGIDLGCLDLLKRFGITSESELRNRLGLAKQSTDSGNDVYKGAEDLWDDSKDAEAGNHPEDENTGNRSTDSSDAGDAGGRNEHTSTGERSHGGGNGNTNGKGNTGQGTGRSGNPTSKGATNASGGRKFISYIGTHPEEDDSDPDGLDQAARMALEELAIQKIISIEPNLRRTANCNTGYDLFENDNAGHTIRWVEVKAMTGSLIDRPVGLSKAQFDWGSKHGSAFWLYIVEHAADSNFAKILRIQNPVGLARTFTFDHGWAIVAETH